MSQSSPSKHTEGIGKTARHWPQRMFLQSYAMCYCGEVIYLYTPEEKWMRPAMLCGTIVLVVLVGLCGTIRRVAAVTVNIPASKDNTLYESPQGNVSNGAGRHFFAGATLSGALRRGLVAFDIARHVPAGSIITSATLKLRMTMTAASSQTMRLHRLLADWGKGSRMPQTRRRRDACHHQ